jgi:hypothetical protein
MAMPLDRREHRRAWRLALGLPACALLALMSGCAATATRVMPDHAADPREAFVYGRFVLVSASAEAQTLERNLAFVMRCADGQSIEFRFGMEAVPSLLKVAPSNCSFTEAVATTVGGSPPRASMSAAQLGLPTNLRFEAGTATYLGDFTAVNVLVGSDRNHFEGAGTRRTVAISPRPVQNRFDTTTAEVMEAFPGLKSIRFRPGEHLK